MTIRTHIRAYLVAVVVGIFVFVFGPGFMVIVYLRTAPAWLQAVILVAAMVAGYFAVHFVFARLLGASCPQCANTVFLRLDRNGEIVYGCRQCTFLHRTGVFERNLD